MAQGRCVAPAWPSCRAIPRPIPLAAPVTRQTLPFRDGDILTLDCDAMNKCSVVLHCYSVGCCSLLLFCSLFSWSCNFIVGKAPLTVECEKLNKMNITIRQYPSWMPDIVLNVVIVSCPSQYSQHAAYTHKYKFKLIRMGNTLWPTIRIKAASWSVQWWLLDLRPGPLEWNISRDYFSGVPQVYHIG